ncbi:hypothetical protein F4810DRAFT_720265 [Camillea tinctor]|nr:hypothetical protein F4810DRAFT_720265 [Camillea tinctor]
MKSFAGILFAVILALCSGLTVGAGNQNDNTTTASFPTVGTYGENPRVMRMAKGTHTYAPIATKVGGAKTPAQPTAQRDGLCEFVFGHSCAWFNRRRSYRSQAHDVDARPLTTDWVGPTVAGTGLSSSVTDNNSVGINRGANAWLHLSSLLFPVLVSLLTITYQQYTKREDGMSMGAIPSVDGAYGDHPPNAPSGGYGYPPNVPTIVQTWIKTVTVSLSYIPPSPLSTPSTPSPPPDSTPVFHNATVSISSTSSSSETVTTLEQTPTPQTETVSTFIFTPSSFTYTKHTTWSFETLLTTVTPTPPPTVDTSAARTTAEVNYPLMCCMVAFALFGSVVYAFRSGPRIYSTSSSSGDLRVAKNDGREADNKSYFVEGVDNEGPNAQVQKTTMDFVNPTSKFEYNGRALAVK